MSANMEEKDVDAKTVEEVVYANMVDAEPNAKTVEEVIG